MGRIMSGNKGELFFMLGFLPVEGEVYRRKFDFLISFFVYGWSMDTGLTVKKGLVPQTYG